MTQCMVRPCVARVFVEIAVSGLASMYPASLIGVVAPGHHGYQRARDLISGQASTRPFGSPVLACAGKTDPPSRLILSQTSAGMSHRLAMSSPAPRFAWFCDRRRRMRINRLGSGLDLPNLESSTPSENTPGDASQLVGERDRKDIAVQSLPGGLDPGFEPVALPALRLDQHDPCGLNEQNPQIAIAALGYLAKNGEVPGSRSALGTRPSQIVGAREWGRMG